ncbi:MAG: T9SS type A sorting domain-containing protein [Bacteroidetes bacterium]|nr:T9SS type A sorting domain-containing protein [Bacteroidota bacterium]
MRFGNGHVVSWFTNSLIDRDGHVILHGVVDDTCSLGSTVMLKTDKKGNILWENRSDMGDLAALKQDKDGNYIELANTEDFIRTTSDSSNEVIFIMRTTGYTKIELPITEDLLLLPSGSKVSCGHLGISTIHDFDPPLTHVSYLTFSGDYRPGPPPIAKVYSYFYPKFKGLALLNNAIYAVGNYDFGRVHSAIFKLDTLGNVLANYGYWSDFVIGNDTFNYDEFTKTEVVNNKLFVCGWATCINFDAGNHAVITGYFDTSTGAFSGTAITIPSYDYIDAMDAKAIDSNEYFLTLSSKNRTFYARIKDSTVEWCKKLDYDSGTVCNSLQYQHDTLILAGWTIEKGLQTAYCSYINTKDSTFSCISDTIIQLQTFKLYPDTNRFIQEDKYMVLEIPPRPVGDNILRMTGTILCNDTPATVKQVGINENRLLIYPNPCTDYVTIQNTNHYRVNNISIVSPQGATIIQLHLNNSTEGKIPITLSSNYKGVAFCIVTTDVGTFTQKLFME